jgi:hypothetical protein
LFGFVLPVDRIVNELSHRRRDFPTLHIEARLSGIGTGWPEQVSMDLHPRLGLRIQDDEQGRWLLHHGRLVAGTLPRIPLWVPQLEILALQEPDALRAWLDQIGVDHTRNALARCDETDCFVIGGIRSPAQVWLDKDRFEVVRLVLPERRRVEFARYRNWDGISFPSEIEILDDHGAVATLIPQAVSRATSLAEEDFLPRWINPSGPLSP